MAESQAPYIHVILSYVVSVTMYINQPLVRILLCNDPIQFLVGMFGFKSEYISPYSVPTVDLILGGCD